MGYVAKWRSFSRHDFHLFPGTAVPPTWLKTFPARVAPDPKPLPPTHSPLHHVPASCHTQHSLEMWDHGNVMTATQTCTARGGCRMYWLDWSGHNITLLVCHTLFAYNTSIIIVTQLYHPG